MSYLDTSVRERPDLSSRPILSALPTPLHHVGLVDRVSLSLGTWLLVHSTAHVRARSDRVAHAQNLRVVREREARELAAQRTWFLSAR